IARVEDPRGRDGLAGIEALASQGREAHRRAERDDRREPEQLGSAADSLPKAARTRTHGFTLPHARNDTTPPFGGSSIGATGFEPATSPTRTVRATRLRHAPRRLILSGDGPNRRVDLGLRR